MEWELQRDTVSAGGREVTVRELTAGEMLTVMEGSDGEFALRLVACCCQTLEGQAAFGDLDAVRRAPWRRVVRPIYLAALRLNDLSGQAAKKNGSDADSSG